MEAYVDIAVEDRHQMISQAISSRHAISTISGARQQSVTDRKTNNRQTTNSFFNTHNSPTSLANSKEEQMAMAFS
jgi:uncharacterized protein YoaH (UPF0181 family)